MVERSADERIRTTEWEDIQYKHGNKVGKYQTREMEILAQKIVDANPDFQLKSYDANDEKVKDKGERGGYDAADPCNPGDASDDDDALTIFRNKRLAEIQKQQASHVFGKVMRIPGSDYVREITDSSANCWVVGIMVKLGHAECDLLLNVLDMVAQRNRDVKFVSLIAREAVANFPEKHIPCVLLYNNGTMVAQLTGSEPWEEGKKNVTVASVEKKLQSYRVICREEYNEEDEIEADDRERMDWKTGDAIRRKR